MTRRAKTLMKKLTIPLFLLVAPLLVIGGVVLAIGTQRAMALVGLGGVPTAEAATEAAGEHGDHTSAADAHGDDTDDSHGGGDGDTPAMTQADMPLLPFPEMIVNVTDTTADGRQTSRFLKVNLLLVFDDSVEGADRLVSRELYLRDTFQGFLRSLNVADLYGSAGMAMLKSELLRRARAVAHTDAPRDILISDLVIQ